MMMQKYENMQIKLKQIKNKNQPMIQNPAKNKNKNKIFCVCFPQEVIYIPNSMDVTYCILKKTKKKEK